MFIPAWNAQRTCSRWNGTWRFPQDWSVTLWELTGHDGTQEVLKVSVELFIWTILWNSIVCPWMFAVGAQYWKAKCSFIANISRCQCTLFFSTSYPGIVLTLLCHRISSQNLHYSHRGQAEGPMMTKIVTFAHADWASFWEVCFIQVLIKFTILNCYLFNLNAKARKWMGW